MNPILVLVASIAISMLIIPVMWRLAPQLGLIDQPDARKVHQNPIPRVGGWGIVAGALIPSLLLPLDPLVLSYILGGLILFAFGVYDDCREAGHYQKFVGQLMAALVVVVWGGVVVTDIPLLGRDLLPTPWGEIFTVFALVGVMNATNHADGLDGLAGGETLLALMIVGFLLYIGEGSTGVVIAAALGGGILGFLRFNSHPAQVFMGDSGSQFLGYTLGLLVIVLCQDITRAISPAAPALLIGLPIVDILAVLYLRASSGLSWFKATRNHIHHRLMDLGFVHAEVVIIIYGVQALMVVSGLYLRFEADWLILVVYLSICAALFGGIAWAERAGWRAHQMEGISSFDRAIRRIFNHRYIHKGPALWISIGVPLFLILGAASVANVPRDVAAVSAVLAVLLAAELLAGRDSIFIVVRAAVYANCVFVVYLTEYFASPLWRRFSALEDIAYSTLVISVLLIARYSGQMAFRTSPTDYLIVFALIVVATVGGEALHDQTMAMVVVKSIAVLYACELLLTRQTARYSPLNLAAVVALTLLGYRGLTLAQA